MAKYKRKVKEALEARRRDFDNIPNKEYLRQQGLHMNRPGSQNRRKGYGKRGNRR